MQEVWAEFENMFYSWLLNSTYAADHEKIGGQNIIANIMINVILYLSV